MLAHKHIINRDEAGDTIIEVLLGLTIMTTVLIASFSAVSTAFRLGDNARERSVAINLLQQQAEALRNYRDSQATNWNGVHDSISGVTGGFAAANPFHMAKAGSGWVPVAGALTSSHYTIGIRASRILTSPLGADFADGSGRYDRLKFDFTATWQGRGGSAGPQNSAISTTLASLVGLSPCRNNTANAATCNLAGGGGPAPGAVSTTYKIDSVKFCESTGMARCVSPNDTEETPDLGADGGVAKRFNSDVPVRTYDSAPGPYGYTFNDSISSIKIIVKNAPSCPIPVDWSVTVDGALVGAATSTDDVNYEQLTFGGLSIPAGTHVLGVSIGNTLPCGGGGGGVGGGGGGGSSVYFDYMVVQS